MAGSSYAQLAFDNSANKDTKNRKRRMLFSRQLFETFTGVHSLQKLAVHYFRTSVGLNSHHKGTAIRTTNAPKSFVFGKPCCPDTPVKCSFANASFAHSIAQPFCPLFRF